MKKKAPEKEKPPPTPPEERNDLSEEAKAVSAEDFTSELRAFVWSVVSFEKLEAGNLTYAQAEEKLSELEAKNVSGLCIVPDEVAARLPERN